MSKKEAVAKIKGSHEYPNIYGYVRFRTICEGVLVTATICNLPDSNLCGIFGFHIHEGNNCSGNDNDPFADAGSHYNPTNAQHPCHAGDLPPLFGNDGFAYMSFVTKRFTIDEILGKTVVIHSNYDDFNTQPSGHSGTKIACGEIQCTSDSDK